MLNRRPSKPPRMPRFSRKQESAARVRSSRRLLFESLETRELLSAANLAEVPFLDGEREDPTSRLVNYLGGNKTTESRATLDYTEAVVHSGSGGYQFAVDGTLTAGNAAFAQMTWGATGFGPDYLDTRDLSHYEELAVWVRNATGQPLTLELGIKDFEDSNLKQARWVHPVSATDAWVEVRASLDFLPEWVGPGQAGWIIDGQRPDLTRAQSFSFAVVANQGSPVSGSLYLDEMRLVEPGGPVDPATADVDAMVDRLARRQFDALWGARDQATGLSPKISAHQDVMAVNVTAALVKSLPGAVERDWITQSQADDYVGTLVGTLGQMLDRAHYLPARYVDRVSLDAADAQEESIIDAAMMYLALYQYRHGYGVAPTLPSAIDQVLSRFDFQPFATAGGWRMAYDLSTGVLTDARFDGYSGEVGLVSLAAHLAGQLDMATLYHSATFRAAFSASNAGPSYLMHSDDRFQAPFLQWLFPLFVDVADRGPDNYPDPALRSNPRANAKAYQQDVIARLATAGQPGGLQPDAGNDWRGMVANYQQYSAFNDFGQPALFMPWSSSFAFLADPNAAGAALRELLRVGLDSPFGLADTAYWDAGQSTPRDVAGRTELWNAALSMMAFNEYRYRDSVFLTEIPAVAEALGQVFHTPEPITEPDQFLLDSANRYGASPHPEDGGSAIIPIYTDFQAGGDYIDINDAVNVVLDGNDPDAARGSTSLRATWDDTRPSGYFQFGLNQVGPRDLNEIGFAYDVRFFAKGDAPEQELGVKVFRSLPGGGWEQLISAPTVITLDTTYQAYSIELPKGLRPSELHAIQFLVGGQLDPGNGTFWLDEVRVTSDGSDPARLVQSYEADPTSSATRDVNVYRNRSFLYDNALAVIALWSTGDTEARTTARQIADGIVGTVQSNGSYFNQRNAGHVFLQDGTPREAFGKTQTLGDNAWFGLALMDLYEGTGEAAYLSRAREISDWAETELKDAGTWGGYYGGYDESGVLFPWRSTEHNIDLFALNQRLSESLSAQSDPDASIYAGRATHAGDFVMQMFDGAAGKFWTGTGAGDSLNTSSVPLDAQLWSIMTLGASTQYAAAIDWSRPLAWAEANLIAADGAYSGFTYSDQSTPDRVWFEGTAQAAALYATTGRWQSFAVTDREIEFARGAHPQGDGRGLVAASSDNLADPSLGAVYDARLHVGATAWAAIAQSHRNPFLSLTGADATAPRAEMDTADLTLVADTSYQPGLDPLPGVNLVSWWDFGATGAARWEAAVQDAYNQGFRAVNLVPLRYVDLDSGALTGGQKAPPISHIAAGIARAKSLGMRVTVNPMVEPQGFSQWRGEMDLQGAVADRFFLDYTDFVEGVAAVAAIEGADRLTIGSELKSLTSGHAAEWTQLIETVVQVYQGALGYAANWDEYRDANLTSTIWESPHIDFIGVDLYPALATAAQANASGDYPDANFIDVVQSNYEAALMDLHDFAAARKSGQGMPIVLAEVGVTPYNLGATQPHSDNFGTLESAEQTNVFEALLRATDETAPWLPEFYVWHWGMDGAEGSKFLIHPDDPQSQATARLLKDHQTWNLYDFDGHNLTVSYTDDVGIDVATLDDSDILVTGPNGFTQYAHLVRTATAANGSPRSAAYRIQAPGGSWGEEDGGDYFVQVAPDQVLDVAGHAVAAGTVGSFTVDPSPWQFPPNRFDVDASGAAVPLDVLTLINEINRTGSRRLSLPQANPEVSPPFHDVNGDNRLTPADVLALINDINARAQAASEGESADAFWAAW